MGQSGADGGEPGPAVLIGQRGAGSHLGHVLHRVQRIAVQERDAEFAGNEVADGGLAAAGDAHHHHTELAGGWEFDRVHQSCTVPSMRRL